MTSSASHNSRMEVNSIEIPPSNTIPARNFGENHFTMNPPPCSTSENHLNSLSSENHLTTHPTSENRSTVEMNHSVLPSTSENHLTDPLNIDPSDVNYAEVFSSISRDKLNKDLHDLFSSAWKRFQEELKGGVRNTPSYNEEGEDEEDYGFKKIYYYNNEDFYDRK